MVPCGTHAQFNDEFRALCSQNGDVGLRSRVKASILFYSQSYTVWLYAQNCRSFVEAVSLLKKKCSLLYLKTQFVPRSKHFSCRL